MKYYFVIGLAGTLFLTSCGGMGPDIMFKTPKNFVSAEMKSEAEKEYIIRPGDRLNILTFANKGYALMNVTDAIAVQRLQTLVEFSVTSEGVIKLPLLDTVRIEGFTTVEAEEFLEAKYANYFVDPFVLIEVINRRVLVFSERGRGQVVKIQNENTNLIEVLAKAGGIGRTGKAYRIKLIRQNPGDPANPLVKIVDFSTVSGLKDAGLIVQANDIIYVEPVIRIASEITTELSPFVGLISTVTGLITTYLLITEITK